MSRWHNLKFFVVGGVSSPRDQLQCGVRTPRPQRSEHCQRLRALDNDPCAECADGNEQQAFGKLVPAHMSLVAIHMARPITARFRDKTDEKRVADWSGRDPAVVHGAKTHHGTAKPVYESANHGTLIKNNSRFFKVKAAITIFFTAFFPAHAPLPLRRAKPSL